MRVESAAVPPYAPLQAAPQPSYPLRLVHCIHPGPSQFLPRGLTWASVGGGVVWVVGVGWGFRVPCHTLSRH